MKYGGAALLLFVSATAWAQLDRLGETLGQLGKKVPVTEIRLRTDPEDSKLRPLETLVVQVRAYGKPEQDLVRLQRTGARVRVREQNGGWLSKTFVFQGKDDEKFHEESGRSIINILRQQSGEFVNKDSFLYTAPEKEGDYTIEADLEGVKAQIKVAVSNKAPSRVKPEKVNFPPEARSRDPYRPLAEHYAPMLAQETWFQPKSDMVARFDFDGDWAGDNNWDRLEQGTSQAYVYYAVMETASHWFLIYNVFHARDYSDKCAVGTCHENDNEGIILTVAKDGSQFGRLQVMETLAHNNVYSVTADERIGNGIHNIDGVIEFHDWSHPVVFIESGGHGIYGSKTSHSRYNVEKAEFAEGTGITYVYKGAAERPAHANSRLVGYELLPILDHWWAKAKEGAWTEKTFDSYFQYSPLGGRPGIPFPIAGSFYGRKEASNKAKPFWGWHDTQTQKRGVLATGQWGLDPAYGVSRNLRFPAQPAFSLDYVYNPYLGIGQAQPLPEAGPLSTLQSQPAPATPAGPGSVEIELRVDGIVELWVAWDTVSAHTISGQDAGQVKATFSRPLPPVTLRSATIKKLDGRGDVKIHQMPSPANEHTAIIRIEDPNGGADNYRFQLTWSE
ncbi:MAG: hypothetical protein FJW20_14360 [Acidimicrobiia bacterium]|nr:hypothetical protein [Acidimicrobiia bacterium]